MSPQADTQADRDASRLVAPQRNGEPAADRPAAGRPAALDPSDPNPPAPPQPRPTKDTDAGFGSFG